MLGVGPGDEVIVSDFSFPATANVVEDLGARPVFADVSLDTFNMLPDAMTARVTPRTKAVIFVDAFGNPSGLSEMQRRCTEMGLPLIEDAACAIGSSENGRRCGSIADVTCFSFHPRKIICTGEGGAILTNKEEWSRWLEVKLNHGASGMRGPGLDFVDFGYNFRLPELAAVMGLKQLAKLEAIVTTRNLIRDTYIAALTPLEYVAQHFVPGVRSNVQSLVFRVPQRVDRNGVIQALRERGVESTIGTYALSSTRYYAQKYADVQPNAARLEQTTITLPCFDGVDVEQVIAAMEAVHS
jgi:perosamine synthetase